MNLLHLSTVKHPDEIEVAVRVSKHNKRSKDYTFYLGSDWALQKFLKHYNQGNFGKALNTLKSFNRKEKDDG